MKNEAEGSCRGSRVASPPRRGGNPGSRIVGAVRRIPHDER